LAACSFSLHAVAAPRPSERSGSATATYYEILGVEPDAGHDQVKQAYTGRALRWHPDRQSDRSDHALELASFKMSELNQAWETLRSPALRAAYDDSLRVSAAVPVSAASRSPGETLSDQAVTLEPQLARPGRDQRVEPAHLPWGCLVSLVAAIVVVFVFTALAASHSDEPIDVKTREPFGVGACVADVDGIFVEQPCTGTGLFEVVERTVFPKACPLRTRAVLLPDNTTLLCLAAL